jgi:hypothetical protein
MQAMMLTCATLHLPLSGGRHEGHIGMRAMMLNFELTSVNRKTWTEILKGKYHCTIDLLFDWFVLVCFGDNKKLSVVVELIPNQSSRRSMVQ